MKQFLLLIFIIFISSCSKSGDEIVVPDNVAPPDHTIENVLYEDYVNRSYILLCGREPNAIELNSSLDLLKQSNLDSFSRVQFINTLFLKQEYRNHTFEKWKNELLNNLDTAEFGNEIAIFNFYLNDATFQYAWPYMQIEKDRLLNVQSGIVKYLNGQNSIRDLQSLLLNNFFYDQINMGAANFVLTSFQHFLNRNPANTESQNGINMINDIQSSLFLASGSSKNDFLNIFFNSNDYFEGSVIRLYNDFLFHNPTSVQMTSASLKYKSSGNYEQAEMEVIITDEFVGIK